MMIHGTPAFSKKSRPPAQPVVLTFLVGLLFPFIKRGIDRVKVLAIQMLLRDAEGIGEISLSNKARFCLVA